MELKKRMECGGIVILYGNFINLLFIYYLFINLLIY
jgi:hypothetical protein